MDWQLFFNLALSLIGILGGSVIALLRGNISDLKESLEEVKVSHQRLEVMVAGERAKLDEYIKGINKLSQQLDDINKNINNRFERLIEKMENKVDKEDCKLRYPCN